MEPTDYGPFPFVPITRRPKIVWPDDAQLAVWVIPNLEFFSLKTPLAGPSIRESARVQGADGARVGTARLRQSRRHLRMMDVLDEARHPRDRNDNTDICEHHPADHRGRGEARLGVHGPQQDEHDAAHRADAEQERELIRYCTKRSPKRRGKRPLGWLGSGLAETWNTLDYLDRTKATSMSPTGSTTTSPIDETSAASRSSTCPTPTRSTIRTRSTTASRPATSSSA